MTLIRPTYSWRALALLCLPSASLVLVGFILVLARWELGHFPGPSDQDVDTLGYGWMTHPVVLLLMASSVSVPVFGVLVVAEGWGRKRPVAALAARLLVLLLPGLVFVAWSRTYPGPCYWFFD
jgi:hypothetical protein